MVDIRRSTVFAAPVDRVWGILRDFNGHESWHPAVEESAIEDGESGDRVGAVRNFRLNDGSRLREQLLFLSDRKTGFGYCILDSPAPLRNYVASLRLRPVTDEDACLCEWRASFDPPAAEKQRLTQFVRDEIIEAGFAALRQVLRAETTGARVAEPAALTLVSHGESAAATAVVLTRYGGPEVLELRPTRVPAPGGGEARIRQTAVGVNFIDVYCRRGSFDLVPPGGIIGMEAAGIVESVGSGVANVKPGDRVGYACAPPGAYVTARTMRADFLLRLPDSLSDMDAAALLLKGVTAGFLLHDVHAVKRGDAILVHAASGGVGQILCRWAKALGASVIGVTSSETKAEAARRAGCDHVIVTAREDFADAVLRLTSGRGVDVAFDAVGKDTFEGSLRCLAPRGHLVSFGQASGDIGSQSIDRLANRSVTLSRPNYVHYTDTAEKLAAQSARLFEALRSGAIVAERPKTYPLAEARLAHADLESRKTSGALVLIP